MTESLLIRGGRVLTMAQGGVERIADVLVMDGRIAMIGPAIDATSARVLDASDKIVAPGFIDTQRHGWQTQMRTVATD